MKKILAVVLAMAMILGMSVTAMAAQEKAGVVSSSDTAQVSISGISGKATVTLYQIAEGIYGENGEGLIRYEYKKGITPLSKEPTSGEINAIHQAILADLENFAPVETKTDIGELNADGTYTSGELNVGAYLAIISGAEDGSIYNPVLLTVS